MRFSLRRYKSRPFWLVLGLILASCASYSPSSMELIEAKPVTLQSLADKPKIYDGHTITVEGCLDFHGSHKYKLWNFDLSGRPPIISDDSVFSLFVEGKYIPRKYRTYDEEKVTQTGETTFTHEVIDERDYYVRLIGEFSNQTAPLNTGGHIVFSDHFEGRIENAKIIEVLKSGCEPLVPHPLLSTVQE